MIKSIRLQNFFGFQDCTINLEKGENVLVGINGSGKSNFFKAIQVITYGILKNLNPIINKQWGGINNVINKCGNAKELAELTFEIVPGLTDGNQTLVYNIKIERLQNLNYKLFEYAVLRRENHADKAIYSYSDGLGKVTERTNHNDVELPFKIEFGSKELYLSTPLDEA
jgi:predicted ATPase